MWTPNQTKGHFRSQLTLPKATRLPSLNSGRQNQHNGPPVEVPIAAPSRVSPELRALSRVKAHPPGTQLVPEHQHSLRVCRAQDTQPVAPGHEGRASSLPVFSAPVTQSPFAYCDQCAIDVPLCTRNPRHLERPAAHGYGTTGSGAWRGWWFTVEGKCLRSPASHGPRL